MSLLIPNWCYEMLVLDIFVSLILCDLLPFLYHHLKWWNMSNVHVGVTTTFRPCISLLISIETWTLSQSFIQQPQSTHITQTLEIVPHFNWHFILLPPAELFMLQILSTDIPPHLLLVVLLLELRRFLLLLFIQTDYCWIFLNHNDAFGLSIGLYFCPAWQP